MFDQHEESNNVEILKKNGSDCKQKYVVNGKCLLTIYKMTENSGDK